MKISVITATYNRANTIERAINSVKSQNYCNVELVIVDGGSNDATISLIEPLISENDICVSEKDNGLYDALNKGISLATGEIVGFLHSDDMYVDTSILEKVALIFLDQSVDAVYGDACFFREGNIQKVVRNYRSDQLSAKNLAWGKMPAHTAMFFRRGVFETYGLFKTTYRICADYEFLCRIVTQARLKSVYLPESLVKMQIGGISTSGLRSTITLNKEVLKACADNGIYTNILMVLSKYPSKILQFIK